ncbi:Gfo/Idh/MocA family oxidoreductase [Azospirillum sp. B21]|uniref:Gfo/Idh/MocA family protein n=1 Tax=Azospirillum sp. B21 TaxID=2607496 RepID=UPI0011EFFE03|nr:Gfo/Idh/MocA family oxidoreductase [Azospirillum sp. B21]KAA0577882.1 Gfo/Idh/MocA family oxidoreductase [Azospirillum sp. B21]
MSPPSAPSARPSRALVVGHGSIGARHARLLRDLGLEVAVVSRRAPQLPGAFPDIAAALACGPADYAVVCTETSLHHQAVRSLHSAGFTGRILIEKPLGQAGEHVPEASFNAVRVGYHLRFDPILLALREALDGCRPLTVEVRAASWLPSWRAGRDYRATESASKAAGGGVLRDLSHELDYVTWLFGRWRRLTALGGHLGCLEIDSDEAFILLAETERCPVVSISLSYIDHGTEERWIAVNTAEGRSWRADLVAATLSENGRLVQSADPAALDAPYIAQHHAMLNNGDGCCSIGEAEEVVAMIDAAETAVRDKRWVYR